MTSGWFRDRETEGWIYFFRAAGMIKIGWSLNIHKRLYDMQRNSPLPIEFVGALPGTMRMEKVVHRQFCAHRAHGEWFREHPEITEYLERQVAAGLMHLPDDFSRAVEQESLEAEQ